MTDEKADRSALRLLMKRPLTFPLLTDAIESRATLHIESLVKRGLVERDAPVSGKGTTYRISKAGKDAYEKMRSE